MRPPKSKRHQKAANARWRAVPEVPREGIEDAREPFDLPLARYGFRDLRIEPRRGYVAWRAVDAETGEVLHCAALKTLLRWAAGELPRMLAARNFE